MKRPTRWLLSIFSLMGFVFSFAYLVVNISVIPERIDSIHAGNEPIPKAELDISSAPLATSRSVTGTHKTFSSGKQSSPGFDPAPLVARLEAISIDLSAITPVLLTWFFGAILLSSYRYRPRSSLPREVRGQMVSRISSLPFPQRHNSIWIYWGFIGTLWGFMLIGWRLHDSAQVKAVETLDILVKAFGTALLSTFTAVVLVYVFAPLVRHIWCWSYEVAAVRRPDENLKRAVQGLADDVGEAAKSVGELNKTVVQLRESIDDVINENLIDGFRDKVSMPIREAIDRQTIAVVEAEQETRKVIVMAANESSKAFVDATDKSRKVLDLVREEATKYHKAVEANSQNFRNALDDMTVSLSELIKQQQDSKSGLSQVAELNESILGALNELGVNLENLGDRELNDQVEKLGTRQEQAVDNLKSQMQKSLDELNRLVTEHSRSVNRILKKCAAQRGPTLASVLSDWLKQRSERDGKGPGTGS